MQLTNMKGQEKKIIFATCWYYNPLASPQAMDGILP